jgi:hypothetical protein
MFVLKVLFSTQLKPKGDRRSLKHMREREGCNAKQCYGRRRFPKLAYNFRARAEQKPLETDQYETLLN